jgi:uncharacterized membrane protein YecN with MAPEG domain
MPLTVTPLYAALLALLFLALSWHVISYRRANGISVGDHDDKMMQKRIRVQANFVEYTPLALLLLLMTELLGAPALALHLLGLMLLVGRAAHAIGLGSTPQKIPFRILGMVLTLSMILLTALGLLGHALF